MGDDSLSSKLAIYISCSATNDKPTFPFIYNIYAGAALNNNTIDSDTLKDNIGDNISEKIPIIVSLQFIIMLGKTLMQIISAFFIAEDIFHSIDKI